MWLPWEDTSPDTFANLGGYPDTPWEDTFANALRDQHNTDPSGSTSLSILPKLHWRMMSTTVLRVHLLEKAFLSCLCLSILY